MTGLRAHIHAGAAVHVQYKYHRKLARKEKGTVPKKLLGSPRPTLLQLKMANGATAPEDEIG